MTFEDLKFEPRYHLMDCIFNFMGIGIGNDRAVCEFENGYAVSVLKGSYLTTANTYELGILKDGDLLQLSEAQEIHKALQSLGLKQDKSNMLVYGYVTKKQINEVMDLLEKFPPAT